MKASFDLVSEPWIPCVTAAGEPIELGLLDTLVRAHELREVVDPSPLVTASLHRLLLAILHRNFGPRNYDAWKELWSAGQFDASALSDYFEQWRHRFDLFDEERPFYQTPGMPEGVKYHPLAVFAEELASGNNPTLFAHGVDETPLPFPPARAAALIVTVQNYDLSGTRSSPDGSGRTHPDAAPLALGFAFMPVGDTLFQTLLLNMITHDPLTNTPVQADARDLPAWERNDTPRHDTRHPDGYVDYLTWQARCLHLMAEEIEPGRVGVRWAVRAGGEDFAAPLGEVDPMLAYIHNEKPQPGQPPWTPYKGSVDRTLWRDSLVLLRDAARESHRPAILNQLSWATLHGGLPRASQLRLWAVGLARGREAAKVEYWRHERLPLPAAYLVDDVLLDSLEVCLRRAEQAAGILRWVGLRQLARELLFPGKREDDLARAERDRVGKLAGALRAEHGYWASLELPFRRLLVDLADDAAHRDRLEAQWMFGLAEEAQDSFNAAADGLEQDARHLRAITSARRALAVSLRKEITADYEEVTTDAEQA